MSQDSKSQVHDDIEWERVDLPNNIVRVASDPKKSCCGSFYWMTISWIIFWITLLGLIAFFFKGRFAHLIMVIWWLILIIIILLFITRYILHVSIFPGSLICVRKVLEDSVSRQVAKVYSKRLLSYMEILKSLEPTK